MSVKKKKSKICPLQKQGQEVMTLVKPQLILLDFNHDTRHLGEHFTCYRT